MLVAAHIAGPAGATPARRPGSLRRTSTIDTTWVGELGGDVRHRGVARDLETGADGAATVRSAARLDVWVAGASRCILELSSDPDLAGLGELKGVSLASGFRGRLRQLIGEAAGSPLYLLLDDLVAVNMVSGYALARAGLAPSETGRRQHPPADVCAGWASEAMIMRGVTETGVQKVSRGPIAADVTRADPDGWHTLDPLPPSSMRRARRLDVVANNDGYDVDAFFRDSHVDADGVETVVHEYSLHAQVASDGATITGVDAVAGALPYSECRSALASTQRVVGLGVGELRHRVHREFTGPTTCTHLNDVMRSLSDVGALTSLQTAT